MKSITLSSRWVTVILLAVFFGIAFFFRTYFPYDQIFTGDWIKFTSVDAYYQMRLVDNLAHNFPTLLSFDPYFIYPGGTMVNSVHFFNWLLAFIIWIVSLGSPSEHIVNVIGVYYPVILSSLTVIPVYFIGKTLYNRWAGFMAAALIALLPGEFLGRTFLGFADTPAAETLLTTVVMAFLFLAISSGQEHKLEFNHIIKKDRAVITKPLVYSLLCGIFQGLYALTWQGALLFVFIITLYLIIQFIINHLRGKSSEYLGIVGFTSFLAAMIIYLPFSLGTVFSVSMVLAVVIPIVLGGIHYFMAKKKVRRFYYPVALVVIAAVALAVFYGINRALLESMLANFSIFAPGGATALTTIEMRPFLYPAGKFTTAIGWGNFTTSFLFAPWWLIPGLGFAVLCGLIYRINTEGSNDKPLLLSLTLAVVVMIVTSWVYLSIPSGYEPAPIPGLAFIALVWLIWLLIRQRPDDTKLILFIVWTLVILVATLVQRRFAYYLVVNVALLTAYIGWQTIRYCGLNRVTDKPVAAPETSVPKRVRDKRQQARAGRHLHIYQVNIILAFIVVFLFAYFPNIIKSKDVASKPLYAPTDAWYETLAWMKTNTPDPFPDADYYYELYEQPAGTPFTYPDSAYGVTSWWDYGYWITRIAHRLPNANPGQSKEPIKNVGQFMLATDEVSADEAMAKLDSKYIVIDYLTTTQKYWAIITYTDRAQEEFFDTYYYPQGKTLIPLQTYRPEYYRSMSVRLFNFDGKAVTDVKPVVFTWEQRTSGEGVAYKRVTDVNEMESYQEALDFIDSQETGNYSIVGIDPFKSSVPLEAVKDYREIYASSHGLPHEDLGEVKEVKVFEYLGKK